MSLEELEHPKFGHIYSLQLGIEQHFGITPESKSKSGTKSLSSSNSVVSSSGAATPESSYKLRHGSSYKPKRRPCIIWNVDREIKTVQILEMASFAGTNPFTQKEVFPNVPRELLMKKLLPVSSDNLHRQQGLFPGESLANLQKDTYIILEPVTVPLEQIWRELEVGPLNQQQLRYINNKLKELTMEAIVATEKRIKECKFTSRNNTNYRYDDPDDDDNNKNSKTLSSPSLPVVRTDFMSNISLNDNYRMKKLLNSDE